MLITTNNAVLPYIFIEKLRTKLIKDFYLFFICQHSHALGIMALCNLVTLVFHTKLLLHLLEWNSLFIEYICPLLVHYIFYISVILFLSKSCIYPSNCHNHIKIAFTIKIVCMFWIFFLEIIKPKGPLLAKCPDSVQHQPGPSSTRLQRWCWKPLRLASRSTIWCHWLLPKGQDGGGRASNCIFIMNILLLLNIWAGELNIYLFSVIY